MRPLSASLLYTVAAGITVTEALGYSNGRQLCGVTSAPTKLIASHRSLAIHERQLKREESVVQGNATNIDLYIHVVATSSEHMQTISVSPVSLESIGRELGMLTSTGKGEPNQQASQTSSARFSACGISFYPAERVPNRELLVVPFKTSRNRRRNAETTSRRRQEDTQFIFREICDPERCWCLWFLPSYVEKGCR